MNTSQVAMIELPEYWNELTSNEKFDWINDNTPFSYINDGNDWSSGVWSDGNGLTINNGGGSFKWFADGVAAFERFLEGCKGLC